MVAGVQEVAPAKVGQRVGQRLAGGPHHRRKLLLGQSGLDQRAPFRRDAEALGEIEQLPREALVDSLVGHRLELALRGMKPP